MFVSDVQNYYSVIYTQNENFVREVVVQDINYSAREDYKIKKLNGEYVSNSMLNANLSSLGYIFNIDVDMIWSQYLTFYNNTNIVTVGSSHVLFAMVLSYIMERTINGSNDITFLAVPYLKNLQQDTDLFIEAKSNIMRKLLTMFCCKWNSKECYFSQELFDKLKHLSDQELLDSYEIMTKYADGVKNQQKENENAYKYIMRLIKYGTNFQKNLQYLKNKINS